jgi:phosphatidylinositol glycan class O
MSKTTEFGTLSLLSFSLLIGSLIFCRGYLLNRQVVVDKTPACRPGDSALSLNLNLSSGPGWCNPKPLHSKLILLLVDALRYDFIHRMPFLSSLLASAEEKDGGTGLSACSFKFMADPPTTTMQRLKALMTGTMPTFIDASANFNR